MNFDFSSPNDKEIEEILSIAQTFDLDIKNIDESTFILSKYDNGIAGFARLINHESFYELATLCVLPEYRKSALGEALISKLIEMINDTQVYAVTIIPSYFQKIGFQVTAASPEKLSGKSTFCSITHPEETISTLVYPLPNPSIYPVGKFHFPRSLSHKEITQMALDIKLFPSKLFDISASISERILRSKYKPDGWNVRQILNHLPDSHMNAYIRFKLTLTEDVPTPKSFDENAWANLNDYKITPVDVSLRLLESVHLKWFYLLDSMSEKNFSKEFYFPYLKRNTKLYEILALYVWHGENHLGQIKSIIKRFT